MLLQPSRTLFPKEKYISAINVLVYTCGYREQTDGCQKAGEGRWAEKGKGIKKYKLAVIK